MSGYLNEPKAPTKQRCLSQVVANLSLNVFNTGKSLCPNRPKFRDDITMSDVKSKPNLMSIDMHKLILEL